MLHTVHVNEAFALLGCSDQTDQSTMGLALAYLPCADRLCNCACSTVARACYALAVTRSDSTRECTRVDHGRSTAGTAATEQIRSPFAPPHQHARPQPPMPSRTSTPMSGYVQISHERSNHADIDCPCTGSPAKLRGSRECRGSEGATEVWREGWASVKVKVRHGLGC